MVAIQKRMDGLELHMHQRHPHQSGQRRRELGRLLVNKALQVGQQRRRAPGRRRHEHCTAGATT